MTSKPHIVVLTATLNDWESVPNLLNELDKRFVEVGAEASIVVVDDGSWELGALEQIPAMSLRAIRSVVRLVLYRNVGNQSALAVGLGYVVTSLKGDYVIVMDSDHEDDPAYVPELIRACRQEGDRKVVFAARSERSEGAVFVALYGLYQWIYRVLTGAAITVGNYCIVPWPLAWRIAHINELWGHFPGAIMKARIPVASIPAARGRRMFGQSSMKFVQLLTHAANALAVHAETAAVRIIIAAAVLGAAASIAIAVLVGMKLFTDLPMLGWTSQVIGIILIFMFQLFVYVCMMTFMLIALRLRAPNLPVLEFQKFILDVVWLTGGEKSNQPSMVKEARPGQV